MFKYILQFQLLCQLLFFLLICLVLDFFKQLNTIFRSMLVIGILCFRMLPHRDFFYHYSLGSKREGESRNKGLAEQRGMLCNCFPFQQFFAQNSLAVFWIMLNIVLCLIILALTLLTYAYFISSSTSLWIFQLTINICKDTMQ